MTRDPDEGEFVKMPQSDSPHSQFKSQRKLHVLFLEYNNQRAWLPSSACYNYQGRNQFEEEAAKAGEKRKKDFQPGKRYQSQYERAVEYSESLLDHSNEERLESVFQKYGWVMVTEQGLPADLASSLKSKKRKIASELEFEATKSTDSEVDAGPGPNTPPAMHRLNSSDRRSSAETAETRLDPGLDNVETSSLLSRTPTTASAASAGKKKRESSLVAAIALNGDSSSDEDASDTEAGNRNNSSKILPLPTTEGTHNSKSCNVQSVGGAAKPAEDEFPRMGDLVWGRMSGFPFWPSFVTKSPQGVCKKPGPNGKLSYHVQFFNWNDESGWVNAVLEFDGLDSFKKIAGKIFPGLSFEKKKTFNNFGLFCSQEEIRQVVQPRQGRHVQQVGEGRTGRRGDPWPEPPGEINRVFGDLRLSALGQDHPEGWQGPSEDCRQDPSKDPSQVRSQQGEHQEALGGGRGWRRSSSSSARTEARPGLQDRPGSVSQPGHGGSVPCRLEDQRPPGGRPELHITGRQGVPGQSSTTVVSSGVGSHL